MLLISTKLKKKKISRNQFRSRSYHSKLAGSFSFLIILKTSNFYTLNYKINLYAITRFNKMLFIRCFVRTEISCCNDCYFYDFLGTIEISVLMFAIYCEYEVYFAVEKASDRNFLVRLWTGPGRFYYFFSRILSKWFSSFKMYAFFSPCPR